MRRSSVVLTFRATENIFTGTEIQDSFPLVVGFVPVISSKKQKLCSWRRCSIVLSFRATGISLTGTRTQDTFYGVLTFLKSLSGLKE
jgi:hypothetical protein